MEKLEALRKHMDFKKTSVKAKGKLQDIERYLSLFIKSNKKDINNFDEEDLTIFINSLDSKYSISTINDIKVYVKTFIKWFYVDYSSRFRNLDKICRTQKAPSPQSAEDMLSLEEVEKIINHEKDLMWKVYWLILFYGGMRPNEACTLNWDQIFFEKKGTIIKIFSKKNRKTFYKSIPEDANKYLKDWKKENKNNDYVFPSPILEGRCISPKSVYARLKRLSKASIGKAVYPYCLRRSISTIKYNDDNLEDDDVANQMGHSKSMKHVYVRLNEEQIKTRARKIWGEVKQYSKEELDKIKVLEETNKEMKEELIKQAEFSNSLNEKMEMFLETFVDKQESNSEAMKNLRDKLKQSFDKKYKSRKTNQSRQKVKVIPS